MCVAMQAIEWSELEYAQVRIDFKERRLRMSQLLRIELQNIVRSVPKCSSYSTSSEASLHNCFVRNQCPLDSIRQTFFTYEKPGSCCQSKVYRHKIWRCWFSTFHLDLRNFLVTSWNVFQKLLFCTFFEVFDTVKSFWLSLTTFISKFLPFSSVSLESLIKQKNFSFWSTVIGEIGFFTFWVRTSAIVFFRECSRFMQEV